MSLKTQQTERTRKKPQRKCAACGQMKEKKDLLRVLRDENGNGIYDPAGKAGGRGAYICRSAACISKAKKTGCLARSLKCTAQPELYEALCREVEGNE